MKILLVGAFAFDTKDTGGQPVKSRELFYALSKRYGDSNVFFIETIGWKRRPIKLFLSFLKMAKKVDTIVMLPAQNGLRVFANLLKYFKHHHHKAIYYDVIGGWLANHISKKTKLIRSLKEFDGIWVETLTMKEKLKHLGITNVSVIPNFKSMIPLKKEELIYDCSMPLKVCTFSRVMKEKGIDDLCKAMQIINKDKVVFSLDIYGPISSDFEAEFNSILQNTKGYIQYCGCKKPNESVDILKKYFALIFPTNFYTEGIPGTIIDAYFSGVPVISSKWESFSDVIDDGVTGIGYKFGEVDELIEILFRVSNNPSELLKMKEACLKKASLYSPEHALDLMNFVLV